MISIELIEERLYEQSKQGPRPSARKLAAKANESLLVELASATAFLPADATALERIYAFKHGLRHRPSCQTCNGPLHTWSLERFKIKTGYTRFCSPSCAKAHPDTKAKLKNTSFSKYGVESPLQAQEVKSKIELSNLLKYGSSSSLNAPHIRAAREESLRVYRDDFRRLRLAALKRIGQRTYSDYIVEVDEELFVQELKMRFVHSCGAVFEERLLNGQSPRCPSCHPKKSNITAPHKVIYELLKQHCDVVENSRSMLKPTKRELDLYVSERKLGIEINGLYWHSIFAEERSLIQLTKSYHLDKTKLAEQNGIKLIHIWEHEAADPRMHSMLLSKIGKTKRIGARKLQVKTIAHADAVNFVSRYHLQGSVNSSYQVGLYDVDELLAVMTFGKPRFDKSAEWELLRFCTKSGVTVVGGASKLLAKFKIDNNPKTLLTYAERRLGTGQVYEALGFKLVKQTAPGYFYWKHVDKKLIIVSRYMAQKHKLPKLLREAYDAALTEQQNMLKAGFGLTHDCGQHVYLNVF